MAGQLKLPISQAYLQQEIDNILICILHGFILLQMATGEQLGLLNFKSSQRQELRRLPRIY
jgi:hypothetical protein